MALDDLKAGLAEKLRAKGLGEHTDALVAAARPAIFHRAAPLRSSLRLKTGASKLGGIPDLPADFRWPTRREVRRDIGATAQAVTGGADFEQPMAFICQIALSSISDHRELDIPVPRTGVLSFFYDVVDGARGYDPINKGAWRLAWFDDPSILSPRAMADAPGFPEVPLLAEQALTLTDDLPAGLDLGEDLLRTYKALVEEEHHAGGVQLGGWPVSIQGSMPQQCEIVSAGIYYDRKGLEKALRLGLDKRQQNWRLVLQVDSCEAANMAWGDRGRLFVWMREPDIRARNFEASWTILQCHREGRSRQIP
jgi:uncharacterized protein YwqG